MHVIRIRDQEGMERIYIAKFIRRTDTEVKFLMNDEEFVVLIENLIEMIKVNTEFEWTADSTQEPEKI